MVAVLLGIQLWTNRFKHIILGVLLLCATAASLPKADKPSVEKNLIRHLLKKYDEFGIVGRPVNDSNVMLEVKYGLQIIQILDLDENKQILRTNCWPSYKWNDSLLQWNPKEYGDITEIRVFPNEIWTPDIKLYNFADERLREHRDARVVVYSTGAIVWIPQALFKSTCPVEITYFPFDTQLCFLEFGSWTYDQTQLDINWDIDGNTSLAIEYLDFRDYVSSNEWKTDGEQNIDIQIKSEKRLRERNHTGTDGQVITKQYSVLIYRVRLRRNPSFFVSILVIPCLLLSSLTLVVFWLPPESPAKMMLGMNIFVAFFVLLLLLADSTPSAVKNFPLIGAYFCLNMVMITMSTFLATFVINLYFRGDRNGPLPSILRRIVIEGLGRLLWIRQYIPLPDEKKLLSHVVTRSSAGRIRRKVHVPELKSNKFMMNEAEDTNGLRGSPDMQTSMHSTGGGGGYPVTDGRFFGSGGNFTTNHPTEPPEGYNTYGGSSNTLYGAGNMTGSFTRSSRGVPFPGTSSGVVDSEDSPILMNTGSNLERDVREMKRFIRMFVNRQKESDRKNLVAMEWRTMALVLDRLFFFMYIAAIGIAIITSICITPNSEELKANND